MSHFTLLCFKYIFICLKMLKKLRFPKKLLRNIFAIDTYSFQKWRVKHNLNLLLLVDGVPVLFILAPSACSPCSNYKTLLLSLFARLLQLNFSLDLTVAQSSPSFLDIVEKSISGLCFSNSFRISRAHNM